MSRLVISIAVLAACLSTACGPEQRREGSLRSASTPSSKGKLATFGGGCFWCVETLFRRLEGVESVESGYAGGTTKSPTYDQVCSGGTGHAEVIQVRYDASKVTYEQLLEVFWKTHDPTTVDRQGADVGDQYRSVVLFHDDEQKRVAESLKQALADAKAFPAPIVTQIVPFERFWPAEDYHQDYFANNPNNRYCRAVIPAKIEKLEKVFKDRLKKK